MPDESTTYGFDHDHIVFDELLHCFLTKGGPIRDPWEQKSDEERAIKDLIESFGVPHTEVDRIVVNGEDVGFDYFVKDEDRIEVIAWTRMVDLTKESRLGRPLMDEPRFVADVHLGKLVRYLRMLGLDCHSKPPWDDHLLAEISACENRVMLTRDVGLLKRGCVKHGIFLRSDQAIEQARQVLMQVCVEPYTSAFSRCVACNGVMQRVEKEAIVHLLESGTKRSYDEFYQCSACEKVYWKGAHFGEIESIMDRIKG